MNGWECNVYNMDENTLLITDKPSVSGQNITYASVGDSAVIECAVVAHPDPHVVFWKSAKDRVPIVTGTKYNVETEKSAEVSVWVALLPS